MQAKSVRKSKETDRQPLTDEIILKKEKKKGKKGQKGKAYAIDDVIWGETILTLFERDLQWTGCLGSLRRTS